MSKKSARLYGRMQHGIAQKQAKVDNLHAKRREIESSREKSKEGKTFLKQKVERLKSERNDTLKAYADTGGKQKLRDDCFLFLLDVPYLIPILLHLLTNQGV